MDCSKLGIAISNRPYCSGNKPIEISKIKTLFNDVYSLFKKIKANENILMREGKIKFKIISFRSGHHNCGILGCFCNCVKDFRPLAFSRRFVRFFGRGLFFNPSVSRERRCLVTFFISGTLV